MTSASAARRLRDQRDRQAGMPIAEWAATGLLPQTTAEGYAIQSEMANLLADRGWRPIGYKIAATNQLARDLLSLDQPCYGRLFDRSSASSPTNCPIVPALTKVIEPEIAVQIGHDLDPEKAPFSAADIEAATNALIPSIEIVETCLDPWVEAGAPSMIADNSLHGSWVHGDPVTDWSTLDLMDGVVVVTADGDEISRGSGRGVDGGCFGAAAWLANQLVDHGRTLRAGDLITTGTVTPPVVPAPGSVYVADFGALGRVQVET